MVVVMQMLIRILTLIPILSRESEPGDPDDLGQVTHPAWYTLRLRSRQLKHAYTQACARTQNTDYAHTHSHSHCVRTHTSMHTNIHKHTYENSIHTHIHITAQTRTQGCKRTCMRAFTKTHKHTYVRAHYITSPGITLHVITPTTLTDTTQRKGV